MSWTLAPSLGALRSEVDARWPGRPTDYDGTIGDAAHAARRSEHNPDERGVVRAIDITAAGIDADALVKAAVGDPRVHYVIYRGTVYSRTYNWAARPYAGANKHYAHVHISLRNQTSESASRAIIDAAANDTRAWLARATPTPTPTPTPIAEEGDIMASLDEVRKLIREELHRSNHERYPSPLRLDGQDAPDMSRTDLLQQDYRQSRGTYEMVADLRRQVGAQSQQLAALAALVQAKLG